ncbi:hypothetical protein DCC39_14630 [Pueribacillus theae]|uniref:YhzD-like protein n=1 Tax=Pueribacillus theae TaxID=2171751 RepID=A0A2U1JTL8_9BACI|nr:YhzD family protein [Pueribacillus theae]PWA08511.1 hypothetical protein DCC39_14630 [Pueribacillus theae]
MEYVVTAFSKKGEKLFEQRFEAENNKEARAKGEVLLEENGYGDITHRITTSYGKLIGFHR